MDQIYKDLTLQVFWDLQNQHKIQKSANTYFEFLFFEQVGF